MVRGGRMVRGGWMGRGGRMVRRGWMGRGGRMVAGWSGVGGYAQWICCHRVVSDWGVAARW